MFHDVELNNQDAKKLAQMGSNAIAYMREMTTDEIRTAFPQTPELEENQTYWALFGADGAPLMLASERVDIASSAFYNNLKPVMPN
jgi:hypothetical protein